MPRKQALKDKATGDRAGQAQKSAKSAATAQHLLETCLHLFRKQGFDETTMRELAAAAGLSPGAFYYYFPSKEAIVQVFYEKTFLEFEQGARELFVAEKSFGRRLEGTLQLRLDTFAADRDLLVVLSRAAVDPRSDLSPFGSATRDIRERTIAIFRTMIDGSDLKFERKLDPYLPTLLWMYMMGMIFFWVFDETPRQQRSRELIGALTPQLVRLIRFTRFPLTGSVLNPLLKALQIAVGEKQRQREK